MGDIAPLILLVDDFEDGRDIYETYLAFRGLRVMCASDGANAIECAHQHKPDLILMDVRMPRMTGTEAMRALRADPSLNTVPIVALTAHALAEERRDALRAGFDDVIVKPVLPDALFERVIALLARARPDLEP